MPIVGSEEGERNAKVSFQHRDRVYRAVTAETQIAFR